MSAGREVQREIYIGFLLFLLSFLYLSQLNPPKEVVHAARIKEDKRSDNMDQVEILFNDISGSRPLQQYIRQASTRWLSHHGEPTTAGAPPALKVEFFRSDLDQTVGCYIEARTPQGIWRNFEYGKGIQHTFKICLKHLAMNTLVERSA